MTLQTRFQQHRARRMLHADVHTYTHMSILVVRGKTGKNVSLIEHHSCFTTDLTELQWRTRIRRLFTVDMHQTYHGQLLTKLASTYSLEASCQAVKLCPIWKLFNNLVSTIRISSPTYLTRPVTKLSNTAFHFQTSGLPGSPNTKWSEKPVFSSKWRPISTVASSK